MIRGTIHTCLPACRRAGTDRFSSYFKANAIFFKIGSLAYNLISLLKIPSCLFGRQVSKNQSPILGVFLYHVTGGKWHGCGHTGFRKRCYLNRQKELSIREDYIKNNLNRLIKTCQDNVKKPITFDFKKAYNLLLIVNESNNINYHNV